MTRIAQNTPPSAGYEEPLQKTRNRLEQRVVKVFDQPDLTDQEKWQLVQSIIHVHRFRETFNTKQKLWKITTEDAFYISTTLIDAQSAAAAIRGHWGIENKNHYPRDVSMKEDQSRVRDNPGVLARLRSFALNITRHNGVQNIKQELFKNCMNLNRILDYNGIQEN